MASKRASTKRRDARAWIVAAAGVGIALLLAVAFLGQRSFGEAGTATPGVSCVLSGTPTAGASPILAGCAPASAGTPIAAGGLTVTLALSSDQAAPQTVTVTIVDAAGQPVNDATVSIVNRHLEMDMGEFPHALERTGDGVYAAQKVGMGMGGRWQTAVVIARPGQPAVTVYFLEKLEGIE